MNKGLCNKRQFIDMHCGMNEGFYLSLSLSVALIDPTQSHNFFSYKSWGRRQDRDSSDIIKLFFELSTIERLARIIA